VATTNALQVIDCRDAPGPLHDVRIALKGHRRAG